LIRKYLYLALLAFSLIGSSVIVQSAVLKPSGATQAAAEFDLVSIEFCVSGERTNDYSISVTGGELPAGASGSIAKTETNLAQGDCLDGLVQLSPAREFERYSFRGRLKSVTVEISHSEQLSYFNSVRDFIGGFEGDSANLVAGLAVGLDSGLSEQFKLNMKTTGLTHLTAVSGANCAIVLGLVWLLLKKLRLGRGARTLVALLSLAAYVALVGWQASVLRSAFMMATIFVCLEFGRRVWIPGALAFGSGILLIVDPWLITDYGFWLSVSATYGLVVLTPTISKRLQNQLPKWLALVLAATVAAQLWCLPILVQLQGGFTTHSVLANLLVEPIVYLITVLGLLASLIGGISPWLAGPLLELAKIPASWIVFIANSLAEAPFGLLEVPGGLLGVIVAGIFVVSLTSWLKHKSRAWLPISLLVAWALFLVQGVGQQVAFANTPWQVVACDVGQGDALIITSQGETALIDVGKDSTLIGNCLNQMGIKRISLLIVTHFDQDHVGGLSGALQGRTIENALISPYPDSRPEAKAATDMLFASSENVILGVLNTKGTLGAFNWEVISSLGEAGSSANEASLGVNFSSPDLDVVTLGDLNERAQNLIAANYRGSERPTVVKVSHHGSADQSAEFYERIGAEVALISVGKENSYGHPTSEVLRMLSKSGSAVFRTDQQGAIALQVIEGVIEVVTAGAG
jgi:competence protein ComEC